MQWSCFRSPFDRYNSTGLITFFSIKKANSIELLQTFFALANALFDIAWFSQGSMKFLNSTAVIRDNFSSSASLFSIKSTSAQDWITLIGSLSRRFSSKINDYWTTISFLILSVFNQLRSLVLMSLNCFQFLSVHEEEITCGWYIATNHLLPAAVVSPWLPLLACCNAL